MLAWLGAASEQGVDAAPTAAGLGRRLVRPGRGQRLSDRLHVRRRRHAGGQRAGVLPALSDADPGRRGARRGPRHRRRSRSAGWPRSARRSPCTCSAPRCSAGGPAGRWWRSAAPRRSRWCSPWRTPKRLFLALVAGHVRGRAPPGLVGRRTARAAAALTRPTGAAAAVGPRGRGGARGPRVTGHRPRRYLAAARAAAVALAGVPRVPRLGGAAGRRPGRLVPDPDAPAGARRSTSARAR